MYGYFIKIIGEAIYGEVLVYQAVIIYFGLIINYGFNVSGVKKVVACEGNIASISRVFSSLFYIKTALFTLVIFSIVLYSFFFSQSVNIKLLFFCSIILMYEWLFQQWYFQALEKLKFVFILSAISKIIAMVLLFLFLKRAEDYYLIPLAMGLSSAIVGLYSLLLAYKQGVRFCLVELKQIYADLKEGTYIFLSTFLLNIKGRADIFLIGLLISLQAVVYYDFMLKVITLAAIPIGILNNAFFARSSDQKDPQLFKKIIGIALMLGLMLYFFIVVFHQPVLNYIQLASDNLNHLLMLMALSVVVLALNITLELNGLIAWGYNKVVLTGAIFNVLLYAVGVAIIAVFFTPTLVMFVYLTLLVHLFDLVFRAFMCIKYNLLRY